MEGNKGIDLHGATEVAKKRRNRVLLIGIDEYRHLPTLEHPVGDCQRLFELLQEHYGIQNQDLVKSLYNEGASRKELFDELYRLKGDDGNTYISEDDNLMLVFSGHGYMDEQNGRGYWAPVDAPAIAAATDLENEMISVGHLVDILSKVKAHHILLIVDACFAGTFARMELDVPKGGDWNNPEEKPSRWALTAGRNQVVADKSPFAEALQQVLSENTELHISIKWIGSEIERRVGKERRQLPWCGAIVKKEFEGGEFFFHRQTPAPNLTIAAWQTISIEELPKRLRHGSRAHLERLKKGRFQFLRIEKLLLTGLTTPSFFDTKVKTGGEETQLHLALQPLWQQEKRHAIVLGEGGMGKTVSLIRLWEDLLNATQSSVHRHRPPSTVPVFIALNEYNTAPTTEKNDFVLRYIARQCLGMETLADDWKNAIWQVLQSSLPDGSPAVLLLLDGFNEITVEKSEFLLQLNKIAEQGSGVQMVITSRYVEIQNFTWAQRSEILELLPLKPSQIEDYLRQTDLPHPENPELLQLFGNPMMLTLYTGSCSIWKQHKDDKRFSFLPFASHGELLWNFHEAQLARFLEDVPYDLNEQAWLTFLMRHLLPYIAFRMEKEGQYFIHTRRSDNPAFNIKSVLEDVYQEWDNEHFTDTFPLFEGNRKVLGFSIAPDDLDGMQDRYVRIRRYLVEKLHLLVPEDEVLRFVHQNFRDFLAAFHLNTVAEMALRRGEMAKEWKDRTFPVYLRRFIGEIQGEHYFNIPKIFRGENMSWAFEKSNLNELLDLCRGKFPPTQNIKHDLKEGIKQVVHSIIKKLSESSIFTKHYPEIVLNDIDYAVYNIVLTIFELRNTLAGVNLSNLDLRQIPFNDKLLTGNFSSRYLPTIFTGSLLYGWQFIFQGHSGAANSACYSPDGKRLLTCSNDGSIREWNENGACVTILKGGFEWVNSACYNSDGTKILTSSGWRVCEWSAETGICLREFKGHQGSVWSASYNPDNGKVITASYSLDGTIKEWSTKTGRCIQTLQGHTQVALSAKYSPDGEKVISASEDGTIKEWFMGTGTCIQTLKGHSSGVYCAVYSPDGKKAISASKDGTIKEWLIETGTCIQTLKGHSSGVYCAVYSPDGKKAISGYEDGTIKEWLLETGTCIVTIQGHSANVVSVCYSPDAKKVVSASKDNSIKEWVIETGVCLKTLHGYYDSIQSAKFSAGDKKILTASQDGTLKEWSRKTGICIRSIKGDSKRIKGACYNHNYKKVLSVSECGDVKEWSMDTGCCLSTIRTDSDKINIAFYDHDEKYVFIALHSGEVTKWSLDTGNYLSTCSEIEAYERHTNAVGYGKYTGGCDLYLEINWNELKTTVGRHTVTYPNLLGLYVQSVDFRHLHPSSHFTEEEKDRLRRYGAIFNDEDERRWKEAVEDAY